MEQKRAIIISSAVHAALFALLLSGLDWSSAAQKSPSLPIEAQLVVKNKDKNLLPKKPKAKPIAEAPKPDAPPKEVKAPDPVAKEVTPKKTPEKTVSKAKNNDAYMKALSSLSQNFARDVAVKEEVEPEGVTAEDASYFDQIYSLIKASFVVPPHINGPQGRSLQAVLRIYLASDGSLNKLDLVTASGDEHFDKAVMEGTKRVHNFGPVPIFLQASLREKGVVVELCPFTCTER
jgi:outer membrane biosynthesis protein TonB